MKNKAIIINGSATIAKNIPAITVINLPNILKLLIKETKKKYNQIKEKNLLDDTEVCIQNIH
jgi:rRNA maturation endonuclease Nob1